MAVHGFARATVDIDLLIEADAVDRVKATVKPLGYWIEAQPMSIAKRAVEIRRISKLDSETGIVLSLDLLLVTPQIRSVWESRVILQSAEGSLWVVSREGLIALKSFRGSGQDQDDIRRLTEESHED
jgi:hypothetical protein